MTMVHLRTTTFLENSATQSGGAIEAQGMQLTISLDDVSFVSNQVESYGGAIHVISGPNIIVHDSRFNSNVVNDGSGGAISAQVT